MSKVFEVLDKEQAAMYRWIRDNISPTVFWALVGRPLKADDTKITIDQAFREAFHQYEAQTSGPKVAAAAQLRVGILPSELGIALANYAGAAIDVATFQEGLSGETFREKRDALTEALRDVTDEILKLQR